MRRRNAPGTATQDRCKGETSTVDCELDEKRTMNLSPLREQQPSRLQSLHRVVHFTHAEPQQLTTNGKSLAVVFSEIESNEKVLTFEHDRTISQFIIRDIHNL